MIDKKYPYRLWKLGKDYRRYAEVIFNNKIDGTDSRPLYFMIGHSFELVLKAFLLTKENFSIDVLRRREYGHNLKNLFDKAKQFEEFLEIIKSSNNIESDINDHNAYYKGPDRDFEYIETEIMFVRPPKILFENLDILINGCEKICEDFIHSR